MLILYVIATCTFSVLSKRQFYATAAFDEAKVASGDTIKKKWSGSLTILPGNRGQFTMHKF